MNNQLHKNCLNDQEDSDRNGLNHETVGGLADCEGPEHAAGGILPDQEGLNHETDGGLADCEGPEHAISGSLPDREAVRDLYKEYVMEIRSPALLPRISFPPEFFADIQNDYKGSSPYHLSYCGFQKCPPGHRAGPFVRTSYLMHVVRRGTGVYMFRNRKLTVGPGQVFLIYPGVTTTYMADREDPWEYAWVGCSGYRIPQILEQIGFSEEDPILSVRNAEDLFSVILRMMEAHRLTLPDELFRTAELLRFFGCMIEGRDAGKSMEHIYSAETYAQVAMRYLNDNYMYQVRISDLAAAIGVERSYLSRVFYQEYHQSPQQYLVRLRLEKACKMLVETGLAVSQIAAAVGYEDPRSFTRMFRQKQGVSPSEFRSALSAEGLAEKRSDRKMR